MAVSAIDFGSIKQNRALRLGIVASLVLIVTTLAAVLLSPTAHAATFTVTSTGDQSAAAPATSCDIGDGNCTLRSSIEAANAQAGADAIHFNITGGGVHTITPAAKYPDITDQLTIDGTTQSGASCGTLVPSSLPAVSNTPHNLLIELDASNMTDFVIDQQGALRFANTAASNSIVRGLVINHVNNGVLDAIMLRGDTGETLSGVTIECNYIGTDPTGSSVPGGTQASSGILQYQNGGTITNSTAQNNLLAGQVFGFQVSGNWSIHNNIVCANAAATAGLGCSIGIYSNTTGNYTGTTTVQHNIISGANDDTGSVGVASNGVENMIIDDNYIGVDITGTLAVPNNFGISGVGFSATTVTNNIVSGNIQFGVGYYGGYSGPNDVSNNKIGVDVNNNPLGNGEDGINIESYTDQTTNIHDNNISNNGGSGISGTQTNSTPGMSIYNNNIDSNQIDGIRMNQANVHIYANTVKNNPNAGIQMVLGSTGLIIENNTVDHNGVGIYLNAGTNTVSGNTVTNSTGDGITTNGNANTVQNNQANNNTQNGLVSNGTGDVVTDNSTSGNHTGMTVGGAGATVSGNTATQNLFDGFLVGGSNIVFTNNSSTNNADVGLQIGGTNNTFTHNYIGVTSGGDVGSNGGDGVWIEGASGNTIGGNTDAARNYISANTGNGIHIFACGGNLVDNIVVTGNYIGTNLDGDTQAGFGNGGSGVAINEQQLFGCGGGGGGEASIFQNRIGGDNTGEPNTIAGNAQDGIRIYQAPNMDVYSNTILPNTIFGNANLGINLAFDSTNSGNADQDLGPNVINNFLMAIPAPNANYYLNHPTLNSTTFLGNNITVNYNFQANQADGSSLSQSDVVGYRLDFYLNDNAQDGAYPGYNQSKTHLGSFIVTGSENNASHVFTSPVTPNTNMSVNVTATVLWKVYTCPNDQNKQGSGPPYSSCGGGGGGGGGA